MNTLLYVFAKVASRCLANLALTKYCLQILSLLLKEMCHIPYIRGVNLYLVVLLSTVLSELC